MQTLFQHLSPAGHLFLQHLQWCSDKILGIWWRYTGNGLAWNPSSPIRFQVRQGWAAPPAGLVLLPMVHGLTAGTVFRGADPTSACCLPLWFYWQKTVQSCSWPVQHAGGACPQPSPAPGWCGGDTGSTSFQPALGVLQHRVRRCLAVGMVPAIQAAVPCARRYVGYQTDCWIKGLQQSRLV